MAHELMREISARRACVGSALTGVHHDQFDPTGIEYVSDLVGTDAEK